MILQEIEQHTIKDRILQHVKEYVKSNTQF